MSIVVTGATGQLGRLVVEELLARGVAPGDVVAGGRALERIADLGERGVRTVRIDYDEPATLDAAFLAGDTVLLVSGSRPGARVAQHQTVVDAAVRAGVGRIAYTSILGADDTPLPLAPDHQATERMIRDSGLPATLLRNGWYTENYVPQLQQARETGVVAASVGDGRVASATRADYAAAIAGALATDGHEGAVYELSGDTAWTFDELAAAIGELLGREVTYQRRSPEEHRAALVAAGLDEGTAGFVVALEGGIRAGALGTTSGDLAELAGRPSTPLVEGLRPFV
ncbi:SDR family oxidoreductase [Geodermatophilus sabuli]|uniref:NAD(P)H dehydrogenase (Quinone) n=1 Tax=Geodermatophilus sabuli TaxID=1564158 RepID=A0A285EM79_9ACTN|nr:SDR family oxidoreductase [Geodermatophilus sabuli]MBB3083758.1 NAD(P)H dehydrogenase (quinone) [Geodermatophilus sabuli]SNX99186.1 NAD(P)H dehydrogenase (quinone) [Geodermatophilus sabuli]